MKICAWCNKEYENNGIARFCSRSCGTRWRNENHKLFSKPKICPICKTIFRPCTPRHKYCSEQCKGKVKYLNGDATKDQYEYISGNPERYFLRILQHHNRKKDGLTKQDLLKLYERQNGLCALSGELLTFNLEKGVICPTNASIDRIDAGGRYSIDNIQLVCRCVNSWRSNLSVDEFVEWCRKVVINAEKKKVL